MEDSLKVVKKKYTKCEHFVLEKDNFNYWKCIYCGAVVKLNKFKENALQEKS